jgi:ribosomal protein S12 methylthiotransferase
MNMSRKIKVALIAMGCEKNVINSEQMLCLLDGAGCALIGNPDGADVTVINTCAFIESARMEADAQIHEALQTGSKVIIAGCYAEWIKNRGSHNPADGLVGTGSFDDIAAAVEDAADGKIPVYFKTPDAPVSETPRIRTSPPHTAYIKIAEGCDNRCTYCVIPALRGSYRTRPASAVIAEAQAMAEESVTELIIVAQDVTRYPGLPKLLEELCRIGGLRRIRLHYLYPEAITDELIDTIAAQPKIARYLDIPMQHASDAVLRAMGRRYTRADLERLIEKLRARLPGVVLRTSVIVGFPGETKEDFNVLCDFLQWAQIPRLGAFTYSREAGTPAAELPLQLTEKTKAQRLRRIEILQSRVTDNFNRAREGSSADVLTEGYDPYVKMYFGRSEGESPDIDGLIFFSSERALAQGEWVSVLLDGAIEADGKGRIV